MPDMELQDLTFALMGFGLALVQCFHAILSFLLFWNENVYSMSLHFESLWLAFWLLQELTLRVSFILWGQFKLRLLNNVVTVKTLWTPGDELSASCNYEMDMSLWGPAAKCYGLDAKCPPLAHVFNAWSQLVVLFWWAVETLRDGD
jgi:hypothetical protein